MSCPSPKPRPATRASSSARRPGSTGKEDSARPESVAPCQLRSLRETLTRRGGRRATAYPPRGGLATGCRLSDCKHWGVGAPGGTRTPGIRLRSPSAFTVFSASCRTRSTLEGTNRLEGSAPPTTPLSSASGARTGKPARLDYRPRSSASEGSSSTYCRRHARGELPSRIPAPAPCGLRDAPCAASSPLFLISASPRNARAKPRAWRLPGPFPTPRTLASGAHGPADTTRGGLKHDLRRAPVRVRSLHAEVSRLREQLLRQGAPKRRARVERAAGPAPQFLLIGVSRGPPEQGRL